MKRKMLSVVTVSLILGFLFDLLFYGKALGISVLLFTASILAATFLIAHLFRKHLSKPVLWVMPLALFFATMVFVRASGFLTFLNTVMVIYLLLLIVSLTAWQPKRLQGYTPHYYLGRIFYLPAQFIRECLSFLRQQLLDSKSDIKRNQHSVTPIVRGLVLSIPFLIVFLFLFSSADLVFKEYIGSLFDFNLSPETVFRVLLIFFVASLFVGAYILMFTKANQPVKQDNSVNKLNLGIIESTIILGSITFLFLIFVLIQVTYLFGGESNIASTGITYSEYARKGFFELITVAVISLALIWALNTSTLRQTLKQKVLFMWLSGALIIEVMIIMLSAFKRLMLYEEAYGFTAPRLYSHLFICWLAVVFVLLFIYILREQALSRFSFNVFLSVIVFMAAINFVNPDALIARQNIARFRETGKIDVFYLTHLSEDAAPAFNTLLNDSNEELQKRVASSLYVKKQQAETRTSGWQTSNIARKHFDKILEDNREKLEANKTYVPPINEDFN